MGTEWAGGGSCAEGCGKQTSETTAKHGAPTQHTVNTFTSPHHYVFPEPVSFSFLLSLLSVFLFVSVLHDVLLPPLLHLYFFYYLNFPLLFASSS